MCEFFWQRMENVDQGDLADIVRPGGRGSLPAAEVPAVADWQLLSEPLAALPFPGATLGPANDYFGDPFVNLRDPLLNQLTAAGLEFLTGAEVMAAPVEVAMNNSNGGGRVGLLTPKLLMGEEVKKRPCNVLSRVLQISSSGTAKPPPPLTERVIKRPAPLMTSTSTTEMMKVCSSSSPAACPMNQGGAAQISSPRSTPGIKRRKSLAKKVVCIPAPATASNRPSTGEVVPSDLWAWRKYGQKPIKGSPYPRGYYRCSSSKGCSARKQVERSRTDPSMLVITYTSEHNHPWPTQRNALAGSTRSQPTKNMINSSSALSSSKSINNINIVSPLPKETPGAATSLIKEELSDHHHQIIENAIHDDPPGDDQVNCSEFDQVFHQSYKPMIPESSHPDDFFADLAELEPDPMSLIFAKGFSNEKKPGDHEEREDQKVLGPFNMFDWVAGSSFGELAKKGL